MSKQSVKIKWNRLEESLSLKFINSSFLQNRKLGTRTKKEGNICIAFKSFTQLSQLWMTDQANIHNFQSTSILLKVTRRKNTLEKET